MMKRDPSIHIRRSSLSEVLEEIITGDIDYIVDSILHKSSRHAIRNRVVIQANAKTKKALTRTVSVEKNVAEEFHKVYQQVNMDNNIRTSVIKSTDGKYTTMKEVAQQAKEFCDMFSLEQLPGFRSYVTIGIKLAGNNYSIYKLKGLADRIIKYYEDSVLIADDPDGVGTRDFYATWMDVSMKYQGGHVSSISEPHLFIHFIHGRMAADKMKATYKDWIAAQFEGIAAYNSTPELSQFYGDNAELRYTKYMGAKTKEYDSKEEQEYFEEKKVKVKTIKRKKSKD